MAVDFIHPSFRELRSVGRRVIVFHLVVFFLALTTHSFADSNCEMRPAPRSGVERSRCQNMLSGMGRGGKGICPQTRTVPQAPAGYSDKKNPLSPTSNNLNAGESLFHVQAEPTACKVCHGVTGNGMGMMAQGSGAIPRNFGCAETMKGISDGQLFWVIKNGSGATGMPAYKFLSDEQIWQLILYLRKFSS